MDSKCLRELAATKIGQLNELRRDAWLALDQNRKCQGLFRILTRRLALGLRRQQRMFRLCEVFFVIFCLGPVTTLQSRLLQHCRPAELMRKIQVLCVRDLRRLWYHVLSNAFRVVSGRARLASPCDYRGVHCMSMGIPLLPLLRIPR